MLDIAIMILIPVVIAALTGSVVWIGTRKYRTHLQSFKDASADLHDAHIIAEKLENQEFELQLALSEIAGAIQTVSNNKLVEGLGLNYPATGEPTIIFDIDFDLAEDITLIESEEIDPGENLPEGDDDKEHADDFAEYNFSDLWIANMRKATKAREDEGLSAEDVDLFMVVSETIVELAEKTQDYDPSEAILEMVNREISTAEYAFLLVSIGMKGEDRQSKVDLVRKLFPANLPKSRSH